MGERLKGKVAIITGGAQGIGASCARIFAIEGAAVALFDVKEGPGNILAEKIASSGANVLFCRCDVTRSTEIETAVDRVVSEAGLPNVLVNNAGIVVVGDLEQLTEEQWDWQFDVNLKSIFLVSRRVIPHMRKAGGGSIINVASESAFVGFPTHPAYCASKAAVVHLSRSMAVRYAQDKIRVNSLCPGTIDTPMFQDFLKQQKDPDATLKAILDMHPLGMGQPEVVAWSAVFMASDESSYMTGSPLLIEGGITAI